MDTSVSFKLLPKRSAALTAGLTLLVIVITAMYAEFFVFPKIFTNYQGKIIIQNIEANSSLFLSSIFSLSITFIADVIIAWALYCLLRPVHQDIALLTAWLRLCYAAFSFVALLNLPTVWYLINDANYLPGLGETEK